MNTYTHQITPDLMTSRLEEFDIHHKPYTHGCCGSLDEEKRTYDRRQIDKFKELELEFERRAIPTTDRRNNRGNEIVRSNQRQPYATPSFPTLTDILGAIAIFFIIAVMYYAC